MSNVIQIVGPNGALRIFGVTLVGVNAENGKKFVFSVVLLVGLYLIQRALRLSLRLIIRDRQSMRVAFWTRQGIQLVTTIVMVIGLLSIWFDDPTRLATAIGLVTAGLAFAMQRAVLAFVGYFIILRGNTFNVGDRIAMGGVRGDVISLSFMQTTIMEMGEPPGEQGDQPSMWVQGRQYTGRIVTVTNDKLFDSPVYNYSREFPYVWDEMRIPIAYNSDSGQAERLILEVTEKQTEQIAQISADDLKELERRYFVKREELKPRVYYRLTDNWVEMSVRFIARDTGVRALKDCMSREILKSFNKAGIGIASGTYEVVGMPPLKVEVTNGAPVQAQRNV